MKLVRIAIGCIAAACVLVTLYICSSPDTQEGQMEHCLNSWLGDLRAGNSGVDFWLEPADCRVLYAVEKWELLAQLVVDNDAEVNIRIDSSTAVGFPIRLIWRVLLERVEGHWYICDVWKLNESQP